MKKFEDDDKAVAWKYRTNPYTNQWFATTSKEIAVMYDEVEPLYSQTEVERLQSLLRTSRTRLATCALQIANLQAMLAEALDLVVDIKEFEETAQDSLHYMGLVITRIKRFEQQEPKENS